MESSREDTGQGCDRVVVFPEAVVVAVVGEHDGLVLCTVITKHDGRTFSLEGEGGRERCVIMYVCIYSVCL